jgi:hypothetical protein
MDGHPTARRAALWATTVLGFLLDHLEAIGVLVLVALVAFVFAPRGMVVPILVCAAAATGLLVGRLLR